MEIKELYPFIYLLVLVGMVLGIGILTLDKFEISTRVEGSVVNESVTIAADGTGALGNEFPISISEIVNSSGVGVMATHSYSVNFSTAGALTTNLTVGPYNFSYSFDERTVAGSTLRNASAEIGNVSSDWLGLIVTVAILAMILTLVIRSFAQRRR